MQSRVLRCFSFVLYGATAIGGLWLCLRFLLPWASPFLLAFALAALMEPLVRRLIRWRWRRQAAAGLVSLSFLGILVWAMVRGTLWLASCAGELGRRLPALLLQMGRALEETERRLFALAESAAPGLGETMRASLQSVGDLLYSLPSALSQWLLDALAKLAQWSPDVLLFVVTAGIGSYFISASYPQTLAFLSAQIPESWRSRLGGLEQDLRDSFGGFFRAQLILMGMSFTVLLLGFWLLELEHALLMAVVTALVDALPVFGTGVVLLPWALYCLLLGSSRQGLGLLLCWAAVNLLRSCLQAKLLGDQMGLDPLASLLAVYVGWRVCGIWGMLLFPILFVLAQQLNEKGILHLWNRI